MAVIFELSVCMWLQVLLHLWIMLNAMIISGMSGLLTATIISGYCIIWVRLQGKNEERTE